MILHSLNLWELEVLGRVGVGGGGKIFVHTYSLGLLISRIETSFISL
jgi:hypothetical protein